MEKLDQRQTKFLVVLGTLMFELINRLGWNQDIAKDREEILACMRVNLTAMEKSHIQMTQEETN